MAGEYDEKLCKKIHEFVDKELSQVKKDMNDFASSVRDDIKSVYGRLNVLLLAVIVGLGGIIGAIVATR